MPTVPEISFTLDELQALDKTLGIARGNLQKKAATYGGDLRFAVSAATDLTHVTTASAKVLAVLAVIG